MYYYKCGTCIVINVYMYCYKCGTCIIINVVHVLL